ncbi:MAG: hypothetical protein HXX08_04010 [Chloroflexi bacterium]|uniref:Uncharacterized protein n=1 Tax=Candidatus Chlorohelix allophototropha TaxID=3003348 RepID=A0A8T7LSM9_9CHLR|nr:hypothetical protein [Chloroflexota bacterium]WJW66905.1 hypothetical protein OZ401_000150 [Chloroflexota bacterium L227-S17]
MEEVLKIAVQRKVLAVARSRVKYFYGGVACHAVKLLRTGYTEQHRLALRELAMSHRGELIFTEAGWQSVWVGAGEEKSVYLVIDPHSQAFALELVGRDGYKDGRLVDGHYFDELYIPRLSGHQWHPDSIFGHTFSGQCYVREFIYGETLAGDLSRFYTEEYRAMLRRNILGRTVTFISRRLAHFIVDNAYQRIKQNYRDTHEANVMIERLPLHNPENKSHFPLPLLWLEEDGQLVWCYVRLTAIDVRVNP